MKGSIKHVFALIAVLVMAAGMMLVVTGCGGSSEEENTGSTDGITIFNSKMEIQDQMLQMAERYTEQTGVPVEVYATTLHYAPCHIDAEAGFRVAVVLPRGTNEPLPERGAAHTDEDKLLTHVNKWLIAHPESGLDKTGALVGLKGENITI